MYTYIARFKFHVYKIALNQSSYIKLYIESKLMYKFNIFTNLNSLVLIIRIKLNSGQI